MLYNCYTCKFYTYITSPDPFKASDQPTTLLAAWVKGNLQAHDKISKIQCSRVCRLARLARVCVHNLSQGAQANDNDYDNDNIYDHVQTKYDASKVQLACVKGIQTVYRCPHSRLTYR